MKSNPNGRHDRVSPSNRYVLQLFKWKSGEWGRVRKWAKKYARITYFSGRFYKSLVCTLTLAEVFSGQSFWPANNFTTKLIRVLS